MLTIDRFNVPILAVLLSATKRAPRAWRSVPGIASTKDSAICHALRRAIAFLATSAAPEIWTVDTNVQVFAASHALRAIVKLVPIAKRAEWICLR